LYSADGTNGAAERRSDSRVRIGTTVISALGVVFGMFLVVAGSFVTWRADTVLGLYSVGGWDFQNIVAGDGRVSVVLGCLGFAGFVLGAVLRRRAFYALGFSCSVILLALSVYELVFLLTRSGVVSAGTGVYMLLGGSVVGVLCGIGGYFMVSESGSAGPA